MAVCQSGQPIPDSTFCRRFIESENDGMCNLCVTLGGKPLYCMGDCFYLHGQAKGRDFVGRTVFVYSPANLLDLEPPKDRSLVTEPSM